MSAGVCLGACFVTVSKAEPVRNEKDRKHFQNAGKSATTAIFFMEESQEKKRIKVIAH